MAPRLPVDALTLQQFLNRQKVLTLYRKIIRSIYDIDNSDDRRYMLSWAREEFKRNKGEINSDSIALQITRGERTHKELTSAVKLSK